MDLFYRQYGDPQAQPIVILHGMLGSSRNWDALAKRLAEHWHVFTLDLRNHGASFHDPDMDYSALVEDVMRFLNKQHLSKVILIGHSLGGKVSMALACQCPERVEKLIVLDISPKNYSPHFKEVLQGMQALPLKEINSRKDADHFLKTFIPDDPLRQFALTNLIRTPEGQFKWQVNLEALVSNRHIVTLNPLSSGCQYEGKTLFIRGGHSEFIKPEDETIIKAYFPQAKLITFEGIGHNVHTEAPDLFIKTLTEFLK